MFPIKWFTIINHMETKLSRSFSINSSASNILQRTINKESPVVEHKPETITWTVYHFKSLTRPILCDFNYSLLQLAIVLPHRIKTIQLQVALRS